VLPADSLSHEGPGQGPKSKAAEAKLLTAKRDQAEAALREAERLAHETAHARETTPAGKWWLKDGQNARAAQQAAERAVKDLEQARQAADRAEERLRPVADHERRRKGWLGRV
jgi:hypothetical protein